MGKKIITREEIIGKQVYTLEVILVGKVKDLGVALTTEGTGTMHLIIETKEGGQVYLGLKNLLKKRRWFQYQRLRLKKRLKKKLRRRLNHRLSQHHLKLRKRNILYLGAVHPGAMG